MIEYDDKALEEYMCEMIAQSTNEVLDRLDHAGMMAVEEAKQNGSYTDRTSNLRNSIDYVVLLDGVIVRGGSKKTKFLDKLVQENPKDIVLIVYAGMVYASYVEYGRYSNKGGKITQTKAYNVISSAEVLVDLIVEDLKTELKNRF